MERSSQHQVSVLFVCMGNICRSPTGEGVMRHVVAERGLEDLVRIDSAGTISYHAGNPADRRMREHASRRGYQLNSIARAIEHRDLEDFDLIIAMDRANLADIERLAGGPVPKVRLLSAYLGDDWPADVPDPYYGGAAGFEAVISMIERAVPAIVDELVERAENLD